MSQRTLSLHPTCFSVQVALYLKQENSPFVNLFIGLVFLLWFLFLGIFLFGVFGGGDFFVCLFEFWGLFWVF